MYKFSIITVVYNAKDALKKTVESIRKQTNDDYEHIIIDGGSSDGTLEFIESLVYSNMKYISEKDNGIYDAMNKGIILAKGEYLLFLNAGDVFASKELLLNIVNKIKDLDAKPKVICGGASVYSEDGKFLSKLDPLEFTKKNLNKYATRTVCHQSIFVSKTIIPLYSDKYRLKGELNWYYELAEICNQNEILNINEIVCNYYLGGTGDKNFWENYLERIKVTKNHNNLFNFILTIPFFFIPLVFRIRRIVFGK